jgi:hypothetical protein
MKTLHAAGLTKTDDVSIRKLLHKAMAHSDPARPLSRIYASALTLKEGYCPREVALCKRLARKPFPNVVDAALRYTFDEGRDKQYRMNNVWLRDLMVGNWKCRGCGTSATFSKAPTHNAGCKKCQWEYEEIVFFHPSGASGSVDGLVDVAKGGLRVVECKIARLEDYEKLMAPMAEHRVRTQLYLRLISESDHPHKAQIETSRAHVVYMLRGHGKLDKELGHVTPFKEFVVHRDDAAVQTYINMANAVSLSKKSEWQAFPEGRCATLFDDRTKRCCVAKECFSGQYPVTIQWKTP